MIKDGRAFMWGNFSLGTELDIAGIFIYNAMKAFNELITLNNTEQIFEILYNLSVGIERLEKITLLLVTLNKKNVEEIESTLIRIKTHDHTKLEKEINKLTEFKLSETEIAFLRLLKDFYKINRYNRYDINELDDHDKELENFNNLLSSLVNELPVNHNNVIKNSEEIRKEFGKLVKGLITKLYTILSDASFSLGINTKELKYNSKAARVFLDENLDFHIDDIYKKELLIYIFSKYEALKEKLKPLNFGDPNISDYIRALFETEKYLEVKDEIEGLLDDVNNKDERIKFLENLGLIIDSIDDKELPAKLEEQ